MRGSGVIIVAALAALVILPHQAQGFGFRDRLTHWDTTKPVEFVVNLSNAPSTFSKVQIREYVERALAPWNAIDTLGVTLHLGEFLNDASKDRPQQDGINIIFWRESTAARKDSFAGTAHPFAKECDIQLLPMSPYTLRDLQAIAMHELGHCLGLAHSTASGVMTRFSGLPAMGNDDIIGASLLHPASARPFRRRMATLKGRIMRGGRPVVGAVLRVIDRSSGQTVVAGFSGLVDQQRRKDPSGRFELPGIPPGRHKLLVEPMNAFVAADPEGYGAPVREAPEPFRGLSIVLPELDAGRTHDVGKLTVKDR